MKIYKVSKPEKDSDDYVAFLGAFDSEDEARKTNPSDQIIFKDGKWCLKEGLNSNYHVWVIALGEQSRKY